MPKARFLLVVPDDDLSIDLFFTKDCQARMDIESIPYKNAMSLAGRDWDYIYIRGPFVQSDFNDQEIIDSIEHILQIRGEAYMLDSLHKFSDLLMEDKWRQYKLFAEIMPGTKLVKSFETVNMKDRLMKKRISGRSRDIHFDISSLPKGAVPEDYIIQERLDIQTEYRAFMVGGELMLPLEIKSSKTEKTKNQVIGMETKAPEEVTNICRRVSEKLKFDLVGLDIAKTQEGFYLLEANRSPQFINYLKLSSKNLAEKLTTYLLEKRAVGLD